MTEAAGPTWFCLKSKPRQEAVAVQNLRAIGVADIVFPRLRRTRRGHDKNKLVVEPLFPGYVFARFDPLDFQSTIRSTRGVLHLVSRAGRPVEVEQAVVDELNALGPEAILEMLDADLKIGAKARVIRGIFTGSEGEIIRLESPRKRIALLLSILGSDQPVELPLDDVESLPDET
jgi:transcriptional antiterminator RfaH